MARLPIALQLFSVRDDLVADLEGTLKKVKEMGYDGVEFAGIGNYRPFEIKQLCEKIGLIPISAHVPLAELMADPERVIDAYCRIGCKQVVIPYLPEEYRPGCEGFTTVIEWAKKLGTICQDRGIHLAYHNHDFEFAKIGGEYALDVLYNEVDPAHLQTQLDTCWVFVGGEDPVKYVKKYAGREFTVHLKDFWVSPDYMAQNRPEQLYQLIGIDDGAQVAAEEGESFCLRPVGYGMQKVEELVKASEESGAQWIIVEQDNPSMGKTPLECAEMSIHYLRDLYRKMDEAEAAAAFNAKTQRWLEIVDEHTPKTDRKIKVGIVGTGWIGGDHVEYYKLMKDVEIVALADLVPGKAEAFAKQHGLENVRCYESDEAMLAAEKELDAVSICTYNCQHAPCAIRALKAGLHVMLEKPFTVTLDEAVAVMRAEKESGKILTIGFQPRMSKNMQMIKQIVESGELGKIYYLQSGGGRRRGIPTPFGTTFIEKETGGVGAVGDIGSYSLDMLLNAVGYPKPLTVTGYTSDFFGTDPEYYGDHPEYAEKFGVDDFAAAFVRLEGGIILDFRISWAMHMDTPGDALILGTKGGLRIPSTDCWNGEFDTPMTLYKTVNGHTVSYKIPRIEDDEELPFFYSKLRAFIDAIRNDGTAPVPSSQILYNQAIIDGICRSAELGREISIEIPQI